MKKLLVFLFAFISVPSIANEVSSADTAWILTSTALVLFMTIPGLALFYGGLVYKKDNVLSMLVQCFAIAGIVIILWFVVGYSRAKAGFKKLLSW